MNQISWWCSKSMWRSFVSLFGDPDSLFVSQSEEGAELRQESKHEPIRWRDVTPLRGKNGRDHSLWMGVIVFLPLFTTNSTNVLFPLPSVSVFRVRVWSLIPPIPASGISRPGLSVVSVCLSIIIIITSESSSSSFSSSVSHHLCSSTATASFIWVSFLNFLSKHRFEHDSLCNKDQVGIGNSQIRRFKTIEIKSNENMYWERDASSRFFMRCFLCVDCAVLLCFSSSPLLLTVAALHLMPSFSPALLLSFLLILLSFHLKLRRTRFRFNRYILFGL